MGPTPNDGTEGDPLGARATRLVMSQPGWVFRLAIMAGMAALAVVAVLLLIPALVIGGVVFVVGAAVVQIRRAWRRVSGAERPEPATDGRVNVRVIDRQ